MQANILIGRTCVVIYGLATKTNKLCCADGRNLQGKDMHPKWWNFCLQYLLLLTLTLIR
jgi:hypothetical protein